MRKKLLSILALPCLTVSGAWADDSGTCGTSLTYSYVESTHTLTISGTGAMAKYDLFMTKAPWNAYKASITSVVIESGVTSIGEYAFNQCTSLASVTIPTGVKSIGRSAFEQCSSLTTITIPTSVTTIGNGAFGRTGLTEITIPASVTSIAKAAFRGCTGLTSIDLPANLTTIGAYAFYGCNNASLTSISIPASVTSIGASAFYNCSNLATVTLNSNPFIDEGAFDNIADGAVVTMNLTANAADGANWLTFYNQNYNFEADANTQVFKAELSGKSLISHEVANRIVDANTAVILKSSTGNIVMTLTTTASANADANSLQGVSDAAGLTAADPSTTYVLANKTHGVGFYKLKSGEKVPVGKAYLTYSGSGAPSFLGFDETTEISTLNVERGTLNGEVYDLQGRRVAQPTKGLYIVNGKTVVIK